jgi:ComF family protein
MLGLARRVVRVGLDLVLPPQCMACDAPVLAPYQLCGACFVTCHQITPPLCRVCGVPFAYEGQGGRPGLCPSCTRRRPCYGRARGALSYDSRSRDLILQFKHADRTELACLFAPLMARAGADVLRVADLLVPVPLHVRRLRARGYNQAALLARRLGHLSGIPDVPDALERTRLTTPMGHQAASERRASMAGAIAVRNRRAPTIAGRSVLVIDDVMTSGATMEACAEALLKSGASEVNALVAARVPTPELGP